MVNGNNQFIQSAFTNVQGFSGKFNKNVATAGEEKTVNPSTSDQVIEASADVVLKKVTVKAVTSAIDSNIKAENIKKDVTILGVTGTYEA